MQDCPFSKTKNSCHGFSLVALPRRYFKEQTELGKEVLSIRMSVWISALGHSLWTIWGEKFLFTKANESTLPKARAASQSSHVSQPRLSMVSPPATRYPSWFFFEPLAVLKLTFLIRLDKPNDEGLVQGVCP